MKNFPARHKRLKNCAILFLLLSSVISFGALERRPYRFDVGDDASNIDRWSTPLTTQDAYSKERGYGWTTDPESAFVRPEWETVRDAITQDGVEAENVGFRADVPKGDWWVVLWLGAGKEDISTLSVKLGKSAVGHGFHEFTPPAEPSDALQSFFRVFQSRARVGAQGLRIDLASGEDKVRLLGIYLIPFEKADSERDDWYMGRLNAVGKYGDETPLDNLQGDLIHDLYRDPTDAFAAYWLQQVILLKEAERAFYLRGWEWAVVETRRSMFSNYKQSIAQLDAILNVPERTSHPLYERALWQRGRLLHWEYLERGGASDKAAAQRDLKELYELYPDDELLAMYNGKFIKQPDWIDNVEMAPGAPAWSSAQREALMRMSDIAAWWVNEAQRPNGEFGGKFGDDVEMLRWWGPLVMWGDQTTQHGWKKLADGVWHSHRVFKGYSRDPKDVEHASEFISDTAPQIVVFTDDPKYVDRLRFSENYMRELWTGLTPSGRRFFKSSWFSSTEVLTEPPKNRDTPMNARAAKAVRYLAWKTRNPETVKLIHEWSLAWLDAAMRTDKGKPRGIIPASIRFPDEAFNGDEPTWHTSNMFWTYFDWHGGEKILDQMLLTYTLTGDERLLEPLLMNLALVEKHRKSISGHGEPTGAGSDVWAAWFLDQRPAFWSVATQWRILTGDTRFDDLLKRRGSAYIRYRITGDESHLVEGMQPLLDAVRFNRPMLTTEVLFTDRVYVSRGHGNEGNADHVKAMLTGDAMYNSMSPYMAVSWESTDNTFTALVAENGPEHLKVRIFSHADEEKRVNMRLWQLAPGSYEMTVAHGENTKRIPVKMKTPGQRVEISLPGGKLTTMSISEAE